ncbi:hypothetical protein VZ95_14160 [Elstera litoralis]|uniref:DUF2491 family protein n=1 Tax=Elstera litoralis TaxID=552518 RepID=A0A0F3IR10_9PROT|nr:hypothetical protein VZ95_14160 [Elstera litoralis]
MRHGLAIFLAALVAIAQPLPALVGARAIATALTVAAPTTLALLSPDAEARSRSSGGYSRSSGSSSRTPSFSGSGSSSGGYSRPSATPSPPSRTPSLSSSDRDASRAASRQGLSDFQAKQAPAAPRSGTGSVPNAGSGPFSSNSGGSYTTGSGLRIPRQTPAYQQYTPPSYAGPSRFGMMDAAMLFFMMNSLSTPSHAAFFHNRAQDPNYLAWRAEADKLAQTDPEMKAKLAEVDRSIAAQAGKPRDPNYLPPDVVADESSGFGWGWVIVLLVVGGAVYWFILRRRNKPAASAESDMGSTPFGLGKSILQNKMSGKTPYRPDYLRLGMGLTLDPSAFILLGPTSPVPRPANGGGVASVTAISMLAGEKDSATAPTRAWLTIGEQSFVEVALSAQGQPENARYFAKIDEVFPADADEWAFWLAEEDGMIGWPEFQTKAGHTYARQWLPGERRIAPRRLLETRETPDGVMERTVAAMLYARDTGLKSPAPEAEYLLVFVSETPDEAWVELYLGIDLPLSSLGLA